MDSSTVRENLKRLAANYRWSWTPSSWDLLMSLPGADPGDHPVGVVSALSDDEVEGLLADDEFVTRLIVESDTLDELVVPTSPTIAYCSPEFGISALLPHYAGGLGVLAGDHLKAASDAGLDLVGVGLFYRQGVFHQVIEHGHQVEAYEPVDPLRVGGTDTGVIVEVPFPGRYVRAKVWRIDVGRTPLILLDTDVEPNSYDDRNITDLLYLGSEQHRIDQEMVLGVGGARALSALGWDVETYHLNEGHAGFLTLELIDRLIEKRDLQGAIEAVRPKVVFTTHTPVPAGIDRLERDNLIPYLERWARNWQVDRDNLWELGQDPVDEDRFNMAAFCLRVSGAANGVSEAHGEVSRSLFSDVGHSHRIGSVTNGVHAQTWTGPAMQEMFNDALGEGWALGDTDSWERVDAIDDQRLLAARRPGRLLLAEQVAETGGTLDPDALVVGFARRFAPYKRANLLLGQYERLLELLGSDERPIHFVFAGKAHPANRTAKGLVSEIVRFSESADASGRFSFIPDYDMAIASRMVEGCDIWLNNPIRPREASGTSGQKVALNGGLNCSVLDGWWAEMYDGGNGWAIPSSEGIDAEARDAEDSGAVLDALEMARDEFYGSRELFNRRIRHAWRTLGPGVTAARMLRDYQARMYGP
jgi:starch phosphorylase